MKKLLITLMTLSSLNAFTATDLENKLDALRIPSDQVTPVISQDKLYIVNQRYSSLINRHELSVNGANNFTAASHLDNKQLGMLYRYHINTRWAVGVRYNNYYNELNEAGKKLYDDKSIVAESDYAIKSTSGFLSFNTMYGKMRFTQKQVVYFDQYISVGYGDIELSDGLKKFKNLDIGFAFWMGKNLSARIGVNNEYYTQVQQDRNKAIHNAMGYVEFGYLFGAGNL